MRVIFALRLLMLLLDSLKLALAIIPGAGGTQRLPRLIRCGRAKELIYTGRKVDASEALMIGLVNKICVRNELINECMLLARNDLW